MVDTAVLTSVFPEEENCMHARLNNKVRQHFPRHPLVPCASLLLPLLFLEAELFLPYHFRVFPKRFLFLLPLLQNSQCEEHSVSSGHG